MSDIGIYTTRVTSVHTHPYADRLEIVKIFGTQVCAPKGEYAVGDLVIYFPPDLMIPEDVSEKLGVSKYLKHSRYDGVKWVPCCIYAAKLRGIPSYGFIDKASNHGVSEEGEILTSYFKAKKYQPPMKMPGGAPAQKKEGFFKYTGIQHYWRFKKEFEDSLQGSAIIITEKVHGTNFRVGRIKDEICVGSHNVRRKLDDAGIYDVPLRDSKLIDALNEFEGDVVFYGEVYGAGVQDMDYGTEPTYILFDIMVNGEFLPPCDTYKFCQEHNLPHVPVLYIGPYFANLIEEFTCGKTHLQPSQHFDGREGIVIKPTIPRYHGTLGRCIVKSVSADYYARSEKNEDMLFDPGEKHESTN